MKSIKTGNKFKHNLTALLFSLFLLVLTVYLIIYFYYVYPLYNLSTIQTKDEIYQITVDLVLGSTDPSRLKKITNYDKNYISFFYTYFIFNSKKYTIWCTSHKNNKFSNGGSIVLYYCNHETGNTEDDKLYINFDDIVTYEKNRIIYIHYLDNYKQEIDFDRNKMKIYISTGKNTLNMELNIDEYNTTMPPLLSRYRNINGINNTNLIETNSPNEWASDNPLIGKIVNGHFNRDIIESNSNFWFDNFIGCNNFFLSEYYWFLILDNDWLIYILFYGKYDEINSPDTPKPIFIKNRKQNKIIHCSPGLIPKGFKTIESIIHPVNIKYKSNPSVKYGDTQFDEYQLEFISNEITIKMNSIKHESKLVLSHDYYNDPKFNQYKGLSEWDLKYKGVLDNLHYVEYANKVNVEIHYNNSYEKFETVQISDGVIPKNRSLPSTIKYS